MTTKNKPAAKRATKKAAPIPAVALTVGDLVTLKGVANAPTMTVALQTLEYDGPTAIAVAECHWIDPVGGTHNSQRFREDELSFVAGANEAIAHREAFNAAEIENFQRDHAKRTAEIAAEQARIIAEQAAAQEQKGAV